MPIKEFPPHHASNMKVTQFCSVCTDQNSITQLRRVEWWYRIKYHLRGPPPLMQSLLISSTKATGMPLAYSNEAATPEIISMYNNYLISAICIHFSKRSSNHESNICNNIAVEYYLHIFLGVEFQYHKKGGSCCISQEGE